MISAKSRRLVTLKGECFDVEYHGTVPGNRDGVLHHFHLNDVLMNKSVLRVSVFRGGARTTYTSTVMEYDRREGTVMLNAIRRAFDNDQINFGVLTPDSTYREIALQPSDFGKQPQKSDKDVKSFVIFKAYLVGYRYPVKMQTSNVLLPIAFGEEIDLEYLGIEISDMLRVIARLTNQGMLEKVLETNASPSEKLLDSHESGDADDWKFARRAIDQARKSIPELDGKVHPKVGAVVVKNGKVLSEAHRGELPQNHAEFVALEKKLADDAVFGATVYTTLEPCTTRNHPKIPCAERLIERKVARVVIGMLDPDRRIKGIGIQKLRSANIAIDFFPRDLMTEVEELNREFTRFCDQQGQSENARKAEDERQLEALRKQVAELSSPPYQQHLGKKGELLLSRLSTIGKRLMRHLVENEPLEVGRKFMADISADDQFHQLTIAMEMGIIRHHEVRAGSGMLVRTDYELNPQFVPVLRDLLYRDE
jgi:pyrimidine deaminase RibD-like protein